MLCVRQARTICAFKFFSCISARPKFTLRQWCSLSPRSTNPWSLHGGTVGCAANSSVGIGNRRSAESGVCMSGGTLKWNFFIHKVKGQEGASDNNYEIKVLVCQLRKNRLRSYAFPSSYKSRAIAEIPKRHSVGGFSPPVSAAKGARRHEAPGVAACLVPGH